MYKFSQFNSIIRIADGAYIPDDLGNSDYQIYLQWVEEGNTADPFVTPPESVPQSISMRQARLILLQRGLLDDIETAIVSADRAAQIEWEYAQEVSRNHPLITQMCALLGLSETEVDNLFIDGQKI